MEHVRAQICNIYLFYLCLKKKFGIIIKIITEYLDRNEKTIYIFGLYFS